MAKARAIRAAKRAEERTAQDRAREQYLETLLLVREACRERGLGLRETLTRMMRAWLAGVEARV